MKKTKRHSLNGPEEDGRIYEARDLEWTRALGITDKILMPQEAAKWLENDRIIRARNVAAARPRRGPIYW